MLSLLFSFSELSYQCLAKKVQNMFADSCLLCPGFSYQHHNINEPAFLLGVAFPQEGEMENEILNGGVKWEKI